MKRINFVALSLVLSFAANVARAEPPLADRVPADAVIYVGWHGSENLPGYNESHLKAIVDQSNIPAVFDQLVPQLIAKAGQQDANVGMALRTIADVGSPLWRHPTAIYFAGVNFNGPEPMPRVGVI